MDDIVWMAAALGAVYGLGTFLAMLVVAADRSPGIRAILLSIAWLPFLLLTLLFISVQRMRGTGPVHFQASLVKGDVWFGPHIKSWGVAVVHMKRGEVKE